MQWIGIAIAGTLAMMFICCLWLFRLSLALRREKNAVQSGMYSLIVGYQRFAQADRRNVRFVFTLMIIVAGVAIEFAIFTLAVFSTASIFAFIGVIACVLSISIFLTSLLYVVLKCIYVDAPALQLFQISQADVADILRMRLRQELPARFVFALLVTMAGILTFYGLVGLLWLVPLIAVLLTGLRVYLSRQLYAWANATVPLEQSEQAELAARIRQWARLAGMELEEVRLFYPTRMGAYSAAMVGVKKPVLFLNDFFLRQTDWRQQDALIVHSLFLLRKRAFAYVSTGAIVQTFLFMTLIVLLIAGVVANFLYFMPAILLLIIYFTFVSIYRSRYLALYMDADRFTVGQTGDPLALLVLLNTICAISPQQTVGAVRRNSLDALLQQPEPRTSWSNAPVGSAIPFVRDGHTYTVPLEESLPVVAVPD